ncbi:hypothetical protein JTB14_000635 [Gonioctena quinquepunctata]|nr:hypothetical protein JTB14_000635 [Gonioctena quinquepunctata]
MPQRYSELPGYALPTPKFTADFAPAEQFQEYVLHFDSDEGKMNINLPAPEIPIPEAIAKPAPSISATVLEPTPSTSTAILETSVLCSFAKVSDVAPNRKTVKKQQSLIRTFTPKKDTLVLKQAIQDKKNFYKQDKICIICGEFGENRELWYHCVTCGRWAHSEYSGWESANEYTCDVFKENNNTKRKGAKRHLFK